MTEIEERLRGHFERRASEAEPADQLHAIVTDMVSTDSYSRSHRSRWLLAAVAAMLLLLVGGLAVVGRGSSTTLPAAADAPPIDWSSEQVLFRADDFGIETLGERFVGRAGREMDIDSDPGDDTYQTLELAWVEHEVEMRLNFYFGSDRDQWWVDRITTYDGSADSEWVTFDGGTVRSKLGEPYVGDVNAVSSDPAGVSRLAIENATLLPFTDNDIVPDPPLFSGKPPALPADVPPTGAEWTQVGHLTLETAIATLQQECMSRAGFDYDNVVDDLGVAMGSWQPHPVLGVFTEAAATRYGYRMAHPVSGADQFASELDEAERDRFYEAIMGSPNEPAVPVTLPDGSSSGIEISRGGCMGEVEAAFSGALTVQEGLRTYVFESGLDQEAVTANTTVDPRVADALRRWSACIEDATGDQAATPNELARKFALTGVEVTDHEINVATADARCQAETELQDTWYRVVAEYQRAALDHPEWFDDLATTRVEIIAIAQEILDERGIDVTGLTPPRSP